MRGILNILIILTLTFFLVISIVGVVFIPIYIYLVFIGSKKRKAKVSNKIQSMLIAGEHVIAETIEYRVMALFQRRTAIAITNSRIIVVKRRNLGGFQMSDRQWKDLSDAQMDENILPGLFGARLAFSFQAPAGSKMQVYGVNPEEAAKIYSLSQGQEQAWEEKRRIRDLEEKRAASGGINFSGFPQSSSHSEASKTPQIAGTRIDVSPTDAIANEINRAKSLLEAGAISDVEFQEIKSKILSRHFQ